MDHSQNVATPDLKLRLISSTKRKIRNAIDYVKLPRVARRMRREDSRNQAAPELDIEDATSASIDWILQSQASSTSHDGGMARFYSLITGWSSSYAATTGHTIPVMLESRDYLKRPESTESAKRMLDWLLLQQLPDGGFSGTLASDQTITPSSFTSASVLIGLAAGAKHFGKKYQDGMRKTADWLRDDQDPDGCWRRHQSPFTTTHDNTFDAHIAWALIEAHRVCPHLGYSDAAFKSVNWALRYQADNGWLDRCCTTDYSAPLAHTLGFAFRGIVEVYRESPDDALHDASVALAEGLILALDVSSGLVPGRIDKQWNGTVSWSCPTANAQISICWLLLYEATGDEKFLLPALAVNRGLRRIVRTSSNPGTSGGCKGSFPVHGGYAPYRFLTPRFCIEAYDLERRLI